MKKLIHLLKSNKGFSSLVTAIAAILAVVMVSIILVSGIAVANQHSVANQFANEMISVAKMYGVISGDIIDERYDELESSLKISPQFAFSAKNGNTAASYKVQEGEKINLELSCTAYLYGPKLPGIDFKIPIPIHIEKTEISTQYWKELKGDYDEDL